MLKQAFWTDCFCVRQSRNFGKHSDVVVVGTGRSPRPIPAIPSMVCMKVIASCAIGTCGAVSAFMFRAASQLDLDGSVCSYLRRPAPAKLSCCIALLIVVDRCDGECLHPNFWILFGATHDSIKKRLACNNVHALTSNAHVLQGLLSFQREQDRRCMQREAYISLLHESNQS